MNDTAVLIKGHTCPADVPVGEQCPLCGLVAWEEADTDINPPATRGKSTIFMEEEPWLR